MEDNIHPDILLIKTNYGYGLKDTKKNMELILSFDDYNNVLKDNAAHPFSKIIKKNNSKFLDCTGGFARDAAILASLNNDVTMIEKNPLIMRLVIDAYRRIDDNRLQAIFDKIKMRLGNCIDFIRDTRNHYDYLYFDFMFNINKNALPSKNEQFLRKIVKSDVAENKKILEETIKRVSSKVIIKEHINSNDYVNFDIINTYKGKTVKYHLLDCKNGYS